MSKKKKKKRSVGQNDERYALVLYLYILFKTCIQSVSINVSAVRRQSVWSMNTRMDIYPRPFPVRKPFFVTPGSTSYDFVRHTADSKVDQSCQSPPTVAGNTYAFDYDYNYYYWLYSSFTEFARRELTLLPVLCYSHRTCSVITVVFVFIVLIFKPIKPLSHEFNNYQRVMVFTVVNYVVVSHVRLYFIVNK